MSISHIETARPRASAEALINRQAREQAEAEAGVEVVAGTGREFGLGNERALKECRLDAGIRLDRGGRTFSRVDADAMHFKCFTQVHRDLLDRRCWAAAKLRFAVCRETFDCSAIAVSRSVA